MRTRQKDTRLERNDKITYWVNQASLMSGAQGVQSVLPIKTIQYGTPSVLTQKVGKLEVMTDDGHKASLGFKDVDHEVRDEEPSQVLLNYTPLSVSRAHTSYGSDLFQPFLQQLEVSDKPFRTAAEVTGAMSNFNPFGPQANIPGEPTNDRLGEVPSKLISALQALETSVSGYEAREFPAMSRFYLSKKGNIAMYKKLADHISRFGRDFYKSRSAMLLLERFVRENTLSMFYGVFPTISDLEKILKELSKPRKFRRTVRASIIETYSPAPQVLRASDAYGNTHEKSFSQELKRVWGGTATMEKSYDELYGQFGEAAKFIERYVSANPYGSAWAVMPFSYMVDQFISIDKVIDNWFINNKPNLTVSYWRSSKRKYEQILKAEYVSGYAPRGAYPISVSPTVDLVSLERTQVAKRRVYSRYIRSATAAPTLFDSLLLFRGLNAKNVVLDLLVMIGLLPRSGK